MTEWRKKWRDSALADAVWSAIVAYDVEAEKAARNLSDDALKRCEQAADAIDDAIEAIIELAVAEEIEAAKHAGKSE
jgi:hypothetical protein